jgi:uncharacterized LabA/DUF88 family protein
VNYGGHVLTRAYAFIDGAAFEASTREFLDHYEASIHDIDWSAMTKNADRIFYFDALPSKRDDEMQDNFDARLKEKQDYFSWLRRIPNMHVREGFTRLKQLSKKPVLTQKGVDIALAVEVLAHAHSGKMDEAVIFANDLDFFPLLDAMTNTRVKTSLYFHKMKTAHELLEISDNSFEINFYSIHSWLPMRIRENYLLESMQFRLDKEVLVCVVDGSGKHSDVSISFEKGARHFHAFGEMKDGSEYLVTSNSLELLKAHFEFCAAEPIKWQEP